MAQPLPYERDYDFEAFQGGHPETPLPGDKVNDELDQIASTIDEVLTRIALLQDDDLALKRKSVGFDQFKDEVDLGFEPPSVWETATAYIARATVFHSYNFYRCLVSHTSGTFATDLAAGDWELLADFTPILDGATDAQAAAEAAQAAAEAAQAAAIASAAGAATSASQASVSAASAVAAAASIGDSVAIAAASATAASDSATAAATSEINAAASAAAAAASAASIVVGPGGVQPYDADLTTLAAATLGAAGLNILAKTAAVDVRDYLDAVVYVADRTALKAVDTTKETLFYLLENNRTGNFGFFSGNYSSQIAADTQEGVYVKANAVASSAGALIRLDDRWTTLHFGIPADGTDQTTAMVTMFTNMGTFAPRGTVTIPYGTKFNTKTVFAAVPVGITVRDDSQVNWGQPPGYKSKHRIFYAGDSVSDDSSLMVASGHHPSLILNNFGTSGSGSATDRYSSILLAGGQDQFGDPILGFILQQGKLTGVEKWRVSLRLQTPWSLVKQKAWSASLVVALNDIIVTSARRVYQVTVAGTLSATTEPSHTSSTAANGTATLLYLQTGTNIDSSRWQIDEDGNTIQLGPSTVSQTLTAFGSGNFSAVWTADDVNNTNSIDFPTNSYTQFGRSGVPVDVAANPGVAVFKGSSSAYSHYIVSGASGGVEQIIANTVSASHTPSRFYTANTIVGSISSTTSATAYNTSSDYRMKYAVESIVAIDTAELGRSMSAALDKIMRLRPVRYKWRHLPDDQPWSYGQIAHEAQTVTPYAVTGEKDATESVGTLTLANGKTFDNVPEPHEKEDGDQWVKTGEQPVYQQMDPSKQIVDLIAAVQELIVLTTRQAEQIAALS